MRGRHPHVDDRHVRPLAGDEREQPGNVLGLADDPEARRLERRRQRLAEQDRVVGKDDPDRSSVAGHGAAGLGAAAGRVEEADRVDDCDAVAYQASKVGGSPLQISIAIVAPSTSSKRQRHVPLRWHLHPDRVAIAFALLQAVRAPQDEADVVRALRVPTLDASGRRGGPAGRRRSASRGPSPGGAEPSGGRRAGLRRPAARDVVGLSQLPVAVVGQHVVDAPDRDALEARRRAPRGRGGPVTSHRRRSGCSTGPGRRMGERTSRRGRRPGRPGSRARRRQPPARPGRQSGPGSGRRGSTGADAPREPGRRALRAPPELRASLDDGLVRPASVDRGRRDLGRHLDRELGADRGAATGRARDAQATADGGRPGRRVREVPSLRPGRHRPRPSSATSTTSVSPAARTVTCAPAAPE